VLLGTDASRYVCICCVTLYGFCIHLLLNLLFFLTHLFIKPRRVVIPSAYLVGVIVFELMKHVIFFFLVVMIFTLFVTVILVLKYVGSICFNELSLIFRWRKFSEPT
jgi:hypothetical protein